MRNMRNMRNILYIDTEVTDEMVGTQTKQWWRRKQETIGDIRNMRIILCTDIDMDIDMDKGTGMGMGIETTALEVKRETAKRRDERADDTRRSGIQDPTIQRIKVKRLTSEI
ncbi:hypothetical protein PVAG01_03574 [Phlyctema vagabunda]|uniref:Uncharacterized protein n=1 Tax=Phlyctema vagabunda TaxID=108571 RepID=A0ABR4PLS4_9HELO